MKKVVLVFSCFLLCFFLFGVSLIRAQEVASSAVGLKQELRSDRQQMKDQLKERKDNAQAAKTEEEVLKEQIKAAFRSGDLETAKQLRRQLSLIHQKNMQEKIEDKKDIQVDIQELKSDVQEARHDGYLAPKIDKDNNPPGAQGGPGTNWENPPGPKGGPGASPDR